jgi:hypothetical protein
MIKKLFTALMFLWVAASCQNDAVSENTEALNSGSQLTTVLKAMSVNNTEADNVIDSTSCYKVKLPVDVVVNGVQINVASATDYDTVAGIMNGSPNDIDSVSLVFPITVEDSDYVETVVSNQQVFNAMVSGCIVINNESFSDCVSLAFPVTIYSYDSGFQIQETFVLHNNKELYTVLQNLGPNGYYSIGYPVSLNIKGGASVTVNNNNDLLEAINNAFDGCEQGGCTNPRVLVDDLAMYMTFSNEIAADLKGNTVIVPENIAYTADRSGNENCAIAFNGTQFLQIPATLDNAIVQGQEFSISLWFRMQNTNNGDLEKIFSKGNVNGVGFQLSVKDLNAPLFAAGEIEDVVDTAWKADAALPVDTANWHHLVITVDTDKNIRLYRDGELRNSQLNSNIHIGDNAMDYFIGNNFKGFLDDLRVYKKLLSPQDVQVLYELDGDCNTCLE